MSQSIAAINEFSAAWSGAIVRASWQGGLAILLAWALCRAWPRPSPAVQCWLWRLAYAKLLVAFLWTTPIALPVLPAETAVPVSMSAKLSESVPASRHLAAFPAIETPVSPTLASWLMPLWLVGVALSMLRLGQTWRRTLRLRSRCRLLHDEQLTMCHAELCRRLGLRRTPILLASAEINGPLFLGLLRPAIVLPIALVETLGMADLRLILAHELAHYKRRDLFWGWLPASAEALFFFHPLVRLARREWRLAQEMACDELALWWTCVAPGTYGGMLVHLAAGNRTDSQPKLAAVAAVESFQTLKRRLNAMKDLRHVSRRRQWAAVLALAVVGALGVVPWRVTAQDAGAAIEKAPTKSQNVAGDDSQKKPNASARVCQMDFIMVDSRLGGFTRIPRMRTIDGQMVMCRIASADMMSDGMDQWMEKGRGPVLSHPMPAPPIPRAPARMPKMPGPPPPKTIPYESGTRPGEKLTLGDTVEVKAKFLDRDRAQIDLSWQKNAAEHADKEGFLVKGEVLRAIRTVELGKAVTLVMAKDSHGKPQQWIEVTVTEPDDDASPVRPPLRLSPNPVPQ